MNPTTTRTRTGITLDKTPGMGTGTEQGTPTPRMVRRPGYPLVGHRRGLRSNDLVTLASALWIECLERGALSPVPGTIDPDTGNVAPVRL